MFLLPPSKTVPRASNHLLHAFVRESWNLQDPRQQAGGACYPPESVSPPVEQHLHRGRWQDSVSDVKLPLPLGYFSKLI